MNYIPDERANVDIKACQQSVQNLQNIIQGLTNRERYLLKVNNSLSNDMKDLDSKCKAERATYLKNEVEYSENKELQNQKIANLIASNKTIEDSLLTEKEHYRKLQGDLEVQQTLSISNANELKEINEFSKQEILKQFESLSNKLEMQDKLVNELQESREIVRILLLRSEKMRNQKMKLILDEKSTSILSYSKKLDEPNGVSTEANFQDCLKNIETHQIIISELHDAKTKYENLLKIEQANKEKLKKTSDDIKGSILKLIKYIEETNESFKKTLVRQLEYSQKNSETQINEVNKLQETIEKYKKLLKSQKEKTEKLAENLKYKNESILQLNKTLEEMKEQFNKTSLAKQECTKTEKDEQNYQDPSEKGITKTMSEGIPTVEKANLEKLKHLKELTTKLKGEINSLEIENFQLKNNLISKADKLNILIKTKNKLRNSNSSSGKLKKLMLEKILLEEEVMSLKFKVKEYLEKLKIFEAKNFDEKILELNTERLNLISQMKNNAENYSTLQTKNKKLDLELEATNKQLVEAKAEINQLKIKNESNRNQNENDDRNLQTTVIEKTNLQVIVEKLTAELQETKSKIKSMEKNNSSNMNDLQLEKERLQNVITSLRSNLDKAEDKLKEFEGEGKKYDQIVQKLTNERNNLQAQLDSVTRELEYTKTKIINTGSNCEEIRNLTLERKNLKSQLNSLSEQLQKSKEEIQNLIKRMDGNNTLTKCIINAENAEFGLDHSNGKLEEMKPNATVSDCIKFITEAQNRDVPQKQIEETTRLLYEIEYFRDNFEKTVKDNDELLNQQRTNFTKRLLDLDYKLNEERRKNSYLIASREKMTGEIEYLASENNSLCEAKNNILYQLEQSHKLCTHILQMFLEFMKTDKNTEKLSCSLQERLNVLLGNIYDMYRVNYPKLRNDDDKAEKVGNIQLDRETKIELSTDILEDKLNEFKQRLEEKLTILTRENSTKKDENEKLKLAIKNLSALLKDELFISEQYKQLKMISDSRLKCLRTQYDQLDSDFYLEKRKNFLCEEQCIISSKTIETKENEITRLKEELRRLTMKLIDIDEDLSPANEETLYESFNPYSNQNSIQKLHDPQVMKQIEEPKFECQTTESKLNTKRQLLVPKQNPIMINVESSSNIAQQGICNRREQYEPMATRLPCSSHIGRLKMNTNGHKINNLTKRKSFNFQTGSSKHERGASESSSTTPREIEQVKQTEETISSQSIQIKTEAKERISNSTQQNIPPRTLPQSRESKQQRIIPAAPSITQSEMNVIIQGQNRRGDVEKLSGTNIQVDHLKKNTICPIGDSRQEKVMPKTVFQLHSTKPKIHIDQNPCGHQDKFSIPNFQVGTQQKIARENIPSADSTIMPKTVSSTQNKKSELVIGQNTTKTQENSLNLDHQLKIVPDTNTPSRDSKRQVLKPRVDSEIQNKKPEMIRDQSKAQNSGKSASPNIEVYNLKQQNISPNTTASISDSKQQQTTQEKDVAETIPSTGDSKQYQVMHRAVSSDQSLKSEIILDQTKIYPEKLTDFDLQMNHSIRQNITPETISSISDTKLQQISTETRPVNEV
ncbi:hypothetical protein HHI36_017060 [Cryptolaemus montrouzieri]|uniref:Uncharacterized protein n=1 Tax=Cryptolaemus montrouzieri TaxID=559131 RepID=A0ABD2NLH5_9CUCU